MFLPTSLVLYGMSIVAQWVLFSSAGNPCMPIPSPRACSNLSPANAIITLLVVVASCRLTCLVHAPHRHKRANCVKLDLPEAVGCSMVRYSRVVACSDFRPADGRRLTRNHAWIALGGPSRKNGEAAAGHVLPRLMTSDPPSLSALSALNLRGVAHLTTPWCHEDYKGAGCLRQPQARAEAGCGHKTGSSSCCYCSEVS